MWTSYVPSSPRIGPSVGRPIPQQLQVANGGTVHYLGPPMLDKVQSKVGWPKPETRTPSVCFEFPLKMVELYSKNF